MKVNATKTTYTVFSLSNKEQTVNLKLEGQKLKQDKCLTYLGITFDPRLTWKHQIEKAQTKEIQRLSILKKSQLALNGEPTQTYSSKPTKDMFDQLWNMACLHGDLLPQAISKKIKKSSKPRPPPYNRQPSINTHSRNGICYRTSIPRTEKRHENPHTAVQIHISKNHPMHSKVEKKHPKRLKRSNFLESARTLQKHLEIPPFDQDEDLPTYQQFPLWNAKAPVVVKDSIPGIARKDSMSLQDLETKTSDFINTNYPSELWIRAYTDGSAEEAVRNGGRGVLIEWLDGT